MAKKKVSKRKKPLTNQWQYRNYTVDGKRRKHVVRRNLQGKIERIQIEF